MHLQPIRPQSVDLHTPHGTVELDLRDPCLLRARAGHEDGTPPLSMDGQGFGLEMAFGWHELSDRFGLVAESGAMAWAIEAPDAPAPCGWKEVALAAEEAVMDYLDNHPRVSATAKRFTARSTLGIQSSNGMNPAILEMRRSLLDMIAA